MTFMSRAAAYGESSQNYGRRQESKFQSVIRMKWVSTWVLNLPKMKSNGTGLIMALNDWLRAEQELKQKSDSTERLSQCHTT